jgi:hypothetical protein
MSVWTNRHQMGIAMYDFAANGRFQINLRVGEKVHVQKQSTGRLVTIRLLSISVLSLSFLSLSS